VGLLAAEVQSESGEAFGDLDGGEGLGDGDVGVAAVVVVPAVVRVDTADPGDGAVDDIHDAVEMGSAGGVDRSPLAVGVELDGFGGTRFAVPAVGVAVDLAGAGVAVDDQHAVGAVLDLGEKRFVVARLTWNVAAISATVCWPESYICWAWSSWRWVSLARRPPTRPPDRGYLDDMPAGTTAPLATTGTRRIADDGGRRFHRRSIRKVKIHALRYQKYQATNELWARRRG
jgi:hypothetical protein